MPLHSYLPTVRINDVEQKILSFSFQAPTSALGVRCDVQLADVEAAVERGDDFDLTLRIQFGTQPKSRLIKTGKVVATDKGIAARRAAGLTVRNDSLSIVGVDAIADRWSLAPRVPVILYDPALVTLEDTELDSNVNDEDGNRIFAESRGLSSLDLQQLLQFAYVEKAGFAEVITNIPNYQIPRADFNLNSSFHSVVASFYSLFEPIVFEDDDRLFILDVFGEIPEGILAGARTVGVSKYLSYNRRQPEISISNAVLLTHKEISVQTIDEDEFPEGVTQRIDTDPASVSGSILDGDYRSTIFRRHVAEIHDDPEDPGRITSEVVWKVETETTGQDEDGTLRVLSREVQTDRYSNSWRLKLGYTKVVEAFVEDGGGSKLMQNVLTETNTLQWRPSPRRFGEYEKLRSETRTEGLVLVEGEDPEEIRTPILEASRDRLLTNDGDTIERVPISSKIEVWRETAPDQIEVHVQTIDHLTKRLKTTGTVEHVGTNHVRVRDGEAFNTKQVLLVDEESDEADGARVPLTFDAGYVSYPVGKELAFRKLANSRRPPEPVRAVLASFDAGIRRGSIRNLVDRDGASVTAIITGYQLSGLPVQQTVDGVVISGGEES